MTAVLGGATVEELRQSIRGVVVAPGDDEYDSARAVWNGMIDRRPALVVRCAEEAGYRMTTAADLYGEPEPARDTVYPYAERG